VAPMGFSKEFRRKLGVALPEDHVVERKQGCWNCSSWSAEKAVDLWWSRAREAMLARAVEVATKSPRGEQDPSVKNIRAMIPQVDAGMSNAVFGVCAMAGKGGAEADFVASTFQCRVWNGAAGASIARGGEAADKLPGELMEDLNSIETEKKN